MPENVIPATQPDTTLAGFPATVDPAYSPPSAHESAEDAHNYDTTRTDTEGKSDQIAPIQAVVLTDTGDTVDLVAHGYVDDDPVVFSEIVTTTGLTAGTVYYVRSGGLTADVFTVAATLGGAAVALTTDGTANVHLVITDEKTGVIVSENQDTSTAGVYGLSGTNVADPAYAAPPSGVVSATQPDTTIGGGSIRVDADLPYRAPAGPVPVTIRDTALFDGASYSGFLDQDVALTDTGDLVELVGHGLVDDNVVIFSDIVTTTGLVEGTRYYVVNATDDDFQVSLALGGAAVALTTNGTAKVQRTTTVTDVTGNADMTQIGAVPDTSGGSVPVAPTAVTATALDNGEVRVAWTAPAQVSGAPRIGYYVESSLGMSLYTAGNATSLDIQAWRIEADNQQDQTFTVRAVNKNGSGPKSTASSAVDIVNINQGYGALDFPNVDVDPVYEPEGTVLEGTGGTPDAPVIGTLVTGVGEVTANWTQSTVGTPTGYRVNVYDDSDDSLMDSADFGLVATGVVTGLAVTAGVYVKVLALDEIENSAESAASNTVAVT